MTDPKLFKFRSLDDPIKLNYDLDCAKGLLSNNSYRCKTSVPTDLAKICGARSRPNGILAADWTLMSKFAYNYLSAWLGEEHAATKAGINFGDGVSLLECYRLGSRRCEYSNYKIW